MIPYVVIAIAIALGVVGSILLRGSLAPSLHENPRLMHAFEAGALRARARLDRFHAAHGQLNRVAAAGLMQRIRAFFDVQA